MNWKFIAIVVGFVAFVSSGCGGAGSSTKENDTKSRENQVAGSDRPNRGKDGPPSGPRKGFDRNVKTSDRGEGTPVSSDDTKKMKGIGIALHTYLAKNKAFPFSSGAKGVPARNPDVSWRFELLGNLGQEGLQEGFDREESPTALANADLAAAGKNLFGFSNGALVSGIKTEKRITHFREVIDGTSNTVMLIENPNLKPEDWLVENDITIDEAVALLKSIEPGESLRICFYDARVLSIGCLAEKELSDEQIATLFKPNDLMPIPTEIFSN